MEINLCFLVCNEVSLLSFSSLPCTLRPGEQWYRTRCPPYAAHLIPWCLSFLWLFLVCWDYIGGRGQSVQARGGLMNFYNTLSHRSAFKVSCQVMNVPQMSVHEDLCQSGVSARKEQVGKPRLLPMIHTQAEVWTRQLCLLLLLYSSVELGQLEKVSLLETMLYCLSCGSSTRNAWSCLLHPRPVSLGCKDVFLAAVG